MVRRAAVIAALASIVAAGPTGVGAAGAEPALPSGSSGGGSSTPDRLDPETLGPEGVPADPGTDSFWPVSDPTLWSVPDHPAPVATSHAEATRYARSRPLSVPPGVNDLSCRAVAGGPDPVVLVHGTDSSVYSDWAAFGPTLPDRCVFALNFGGTPDKQYGTGDLVESAHQLAAFVPAVLSLTGADRVDLVGYSQGATVARAYVNRLGGDRVVDQWIGLASPTYGGTFYGATAFAGIPGALDLVAHEFSLAVVQQREGSEVLDWVNTPTDTVPGVRYTTIGSAVDEVIQPASNIALRGDGADNIMVQDLCPADLTGHFNLVYDPFTLSLARHVLDPEVYPLAPCTPVPLGTGLPQVVVESLTAPE